MNITSEYIQQYIRIALYWGFGALATHGITVPDNFKLFIVGLVGTAGTLAWTVYGTRLTALINQISKSPDVKKVITAPQIAEAVPSDKVVAR